MSTAHDLYRELSTLGAMLWQDGDQLRCQAPPGTLTADLIDRLKAHKPDLLAMLSDPQVTPRSAANDPAPAQPFAPDFWDKVALVRGDGLALTNHIMACRTCYAPKDRYCEEGQRLKAAYKAKTVEVWH